jgi:hypothetical protein
MIRQNILRIKQPKTINGGASFVKLNKEKVPSITNKLNNVLIGFASEKVISFIINTADAIIIPTTTALIPSTDL